MVFGGGDGERVSVIPTPSTGWRWKDDVILNDAIAWLTSVIPTPAPGAAVEECVDYLVHKFVKQVGRGWGGGVPFWNLCLGGGDTLEPLSQIDARHKRVGGVLPLGKRHIMAPAWGVVTPRVAARVTSGVGVYRQQPLAVPA